MHQHTEGEVERLVVGVVVELGVEVENEIFVFVFKGNVGGAKMTYFLCKFGIVPRYGLKQIAASWRHVTVTVPVS